MDNVQRNFQQQEANEYEELSWHIITRNNVVL
jgi:hypothetical protein